jgi:hypothetical protein
MISPASTAVAASPKAAARRFLSLNASWLLLVRSRIKGTAGMRSNRASAGAVRFLEKMEQFARQTTACQRASDNAMRRGAANAIETGIYRPRGVRRRIGRRRNTANRRLPPL